jgi:hypothetical protein
MGEKETTSSNHAGDDDADAWKAPYSLIDLRGIFLRGTATWHLA